jgi:hypothetical protein
MEVAASSGASARRGRFKRDLGFKPMNSRHGRLALTRRDLDIIAAVAKHRFISTKQVVRLFACDCPRVEKDGVRGGKPARIWGKSHREMCSCTCSLGDRSGEHESHCINLFKDDLHVGSRLKELFQHGYLDRPVSQLMLRVKEGFMGEGSVPLVYCVTAAGIEVMGAARRDALGHRKLAWVGKANQGDRAYMEHTLAINDISIGVDIAVRRDKRFERLSEHELTLGMTRKRRESARPWGLTVKHGGVELSTVCDLAFSLGDRSRQSRWNFLVEVDRGTMPVERGDLLQTSVLRKLIGYARAKFDNAFEREFGWMAARVLIVTSSPERMRSIRDAARECFGKAAEGRIFLFGTLDAGTNLLEYEFEDIAGKPMKLIRPRMDDPARLFA